MKNLKVLAEMNNNNDHRHPFDIERTLDEMRFIRVSAGLTQQQLADKLGVPRPYITKWEKGMATPSYEHLVMLHRVLCGLRLERVVNNA